ncbi:hypothetical protein GJ496_009612 [Pomphorhynchus laevis]|nr:hypothetical protein GJ496_009612 [Pomphorhynchus laevis]
MRTIDHQAFRPFARFDTCALDSLQKIVATHLDHNKRNQPALSTRLGGLSLRRTIDHSTSAFVASVASVASIEGLPCLHFPSLDSSFSDLLLTSKVTASDAEILSQSRLSSIVDNTTYENLLVRFNQFDRVSG